jgi:hypothetical protein
MGALSRGGILRRTNTPGQSLSRPARSAPRPPR